MKARQFKKLCKKASKALPHIPSFYESDSGEWCFEFAGMDYREWDCEPCWPVLISVFDSEVNTVVDQDSECGISWKPEHKQVKATPKNVFKWVRSRALEQIA